MNISEIIKCYEQHCLSSSIPFKMEQSVLSYDKTTLFCPAGMQQFKSSFIDLNYHHTTSNIQPCLRLNDLEEIGDGSHLLYFNMIGFFSFREKSIKEAIDFFMSFLGKLNILPDYITIHPDKLKEWSQHYKEYTIELRPDNECIWSDGEIGGYCTEFYKDGIEIGNIVNPLGDCIDVGFGLERLSIVLNNQTKSKEETLRETILKIIENGIYPSNTGCGYILRKLLSIFYKNGFTLNHKFYEDEVSRQEKIFSKYEKLKDKYASKPKEWWFDTHGIDLDLI